jgi:predicted  nucleic acid-binding Zn-ribbon protein
MVQISFFLFFILLTIVIAAIRIYLKKDLDSLASQVNSSESSITDPIIKKVIERCQSYKSSGNSDGFHVSVIIDQVYSQDKLRIGFLFLEARRDSWDFVCRSFPNVLISLGLLGTFIGMTHNLGSIQEAVKIGTVNAARLKEPLSGMATAFESSLVALFCGISLTFINLIFNTSVAKYRFLSTLEDYLNNSITFSDTTTLLNGINDSLRSFRSEFMESFETKIVAAISNSFASQVTRIILENQRATQILTESASRFMEATSNVSASAASFENATNALAKSDVPNSINKFTDTINKVSPILEQAISSVAESSIRFHDATQLLGVCTKEFVELRKLVANLITQIQTINQNLLESSDRFKESSASISGSTESFSNTVGMLSESNLPDSINKFSTTITESTSIFKETSTSIAASSGQFRDAIQKLDIYTQSFEQLQQKIHQLIPITQTNQEELKKAIPIIIQEKQALFFAIESIKKLQPSLEKLHSNVEISAQNLSSKSQEFLQLQDGLSQLTRDINKIAKQLNNKFLQGLGFDELHLDNQEIIDLLKKLTLNLGRSDNKSTSSFVDDFDNFS